MRTALIWATMWLSKWRSTSWLKTQLSVPTLTSNIKEEASVVLAAMGLTVSDAFRIMLTRIAGEKALPFEPLVRTRPLLPLCVKPASAT